MRRSDGRRHDDLGRRVHRLSASSRGSRMRPAQPLNWRGAAKMNKMERIYLPSVNNGGLDYTDSGVLFTRARGRVAMTVVPWRGATASGWQRTSASRGTLFSVGRGSPRI